MSLGARIRALRLARGETLRDTAEAIGLSKSALSKLEIQAGANPEVKTLLALARHFGVSVGHLAGDENSAVFGETVDGLSEEQRAAVLDHARRLAAENAGEK